MQFFISNLVVALVVFIIQELRIRKKVNQIQDFMELMPEVNKKIDDFNNEKIKVDQMSKNAKEEMIAAASLFHKIPMIVNDTLHKNMFN